MNGIEEGEEVDRINPNWCVEGDEAGDAAVEGLERLLNSVVRELIEQSTVEGAKNLKNIVGDSRTKKVAAKPYSFFFWTKFVKWSYVYD